ncbi:ABC transporter ATP-binding protein [Treponema sp.]
MLRLEGIRKRFDSNGVEALSGVDFDLRPGEIHALIGENGAGKSTLMHIAAGKLEMTAGTIYIDEKPVVFKSSADALGKHIGMVRQHPQLIRGFHLWEDLILGHEGGHLGLLDKKAARREINALSKRWGFGLDADMRVDELAISQKQKAAILALLLREVRYLILDEPSSVLTPVETEQLFNLLSALRDEGRSIVLISHKLEETLAIADRVSVLRRAQKISTREASDIGIAELNSLVCAEEEASEVASDEIEEGKNRFSINVGNLGPPILSVTKLVVEEPHFPHLRGVDFELRSGEVLAIAGVRESGLETLERSVAGLLRVRSGKVDFAGTQVEGRGALFFRKQGGAYICADRMGMAIAPHLSIFENMIIHAHRRAQKGLLGRLGFLNRKYLKAWTASIMREARLSGDANRGSETYSGGALQRLIVSRELAEDARLVIMSEPGWGLDAASRHRSERRIRSLAAKGAAILLLSTDIDELLSLSDRILVLRNGEIAGRFVVPQEADDVFRRTVGDAMTGSAACLDREWQV